MKVMNMMMHLLQWGILTGLFLTGMIAFLVLCSEEMPGEQIRLKVFVFSKLSAGAVIFLCVQAAKFFNRRGMLPEINEASEDAGRED